MAFDPNNPTASGMVLTFDDEFNKVSWSDNGPANGTLWTDHGINPGPTNGIGNISASQLSVHDGVLDITAQRDGSGNWTSGVLTTINPSLQGFTPKYGYFEADIKIPAGNGAWPAWWLYSADHFTNGAPPSELDIMENAGSNTTAWGATIHDGMGNQNPNPVLNAGVDLSQGFHRFGLLWDPNSSSVTWYLDGKQVLTAPKYSNTDAQQMMMTLNLAMGDFGGGGPDGSTPSTLHMLTDYVRVYQFANQGATAVNPDTVSPAAGNNDPVAHVDALGHSGSGGTPSPAPAATPSADGSILTPGSAGSLVTSEGTWTFSSNTAGGGNLIMLNGQQATNGAAVKLLVDHGHLYADNAQGNWYEWVNSNWSNATAPTAHTPSGSSTTSADGSTLMSGSAGSLVTSEGTWTFSSNTAGGGNLIMLNGQQATNGAAVKLLVDHGHLFADNAQGYWYEWVNSNWSNATDPTLGQTATLATSGSGTSTVPSLTPSFQDGAGHEIFVFNAAQSGAHIANFQSGQDLLDLAPLLKASGYTGTNPVADHVVNLVQSGTDSTAVMIDPTGHDATHGTTVVTLDHVLPSHVGAGDFWH